MALAMTVYHVEPLSDILQLSFKLVLHEVQQHRDLKHARWN